MLFLLNRNVIELDAPELYLEQNWKRIGCGDPVSMMASDAVNFSIMVVNAHLSDEMELSSETMMDIASLLVTKTGANAALFTGEEEARLNVLNEAVLENLRGGKGLGVGREEIWATAA